MVCVLLVPGARQQKLESWLVVPVVPLALSSARLENVWNSGRDRFTFQLLLSPKIDEPRLPNGNQRAKLRTAVFDQ